jgi:hypothetical protein
VPALTPAAVVGISNISSLTTSTAIIDGYTLASGDLVLLTGQSTASQNGLWLVPSSGSWTRPTEFASGATIKGRSIVILNGTVNANTLWVLDSPTAGLTIDTSSQTWINPLTQNGYLQYVKSNISPDELLPAASNTNLGGYRQTNVANGLLTTDAANVGQLAGNQYAYVVSGCVWTTAGGVLTASMTSGTVMIGGVLLTVAAVSSYTFTANYDTYIDLQNNGDGTANINYTAVPNNTISPALYNSGNMLNTIRIAIVVAGTTITNTTTSIGQGGAFVTPTIQFTSTVASGSNGQQIGSLTSATLQLGSVTAGSIPTGGGWALVAHASGQTYTISFTGYSGGNLTGVTLISGTSTLTVSTSDTVTGLTSLIITDMIGNIFYPTSPYPRVIGFAALTGFTTMNLTAMSPIPRMVAPFIIPPGVSRTVRITITLSTVSSTAAAGTTLNFFGGVGNAGAFGTVSGIPDFSAKVNVTGDGMGPLMATSVTGPQTAGSYTAQVGMTQSATGGTVGGPGYFNSVILVEYI